MYKRACTSLPLLHLLFYFNYVWVARLNGITMVRNKIGKTIKRHRRVQRVNFNLTHVNGRVPFMSKIRFDNNHTTPTIVEIRYHRI